jgi:hypothetical protein
MVTPTPGLGERERSSLSLEGPMDVDLYFLRKATNEGEGM